MLFALPKLTELNNEYCLCCEMYLNDMQIVQGIQIFEYFQIICNPKLKDLQKYQKKLYFVKMPTVLTIYKYLYLEENIRIFV